MGPYMRAWLPSMEQETKGKETWTGKGRRAAEFTGGETKRLHERQPAGTQPIGCTVEAPFYMKTMGCVPVVKLASKGIQQSMKKKARRFRKDYLSYPDLRYPVLSWVSIQQKTGTNNMHRTQLQGTIVHIGLLPGAKRGIAASVD